MVKDVGILAAEIYFPKEYVSQQDLEKYDGVSEGKYTIGLGQKSMAVCDNSEDIVSMSMTAMTNLIEKYGIDINDIGRLEVGTESMIDKSKAVKTYLMQMFNEKGIYDVLGVDTYNACYGGTSALFNAVNWIESKSYNGKYAVVVCGDIALYEAGPARPTGGAGTIALLIGPNAPVKLQHKALASYAEHAFDFYKPNLQSEYPVVDGKLSNDCYIRAVDYCYKSYKDQMKKADGKEFSIKDVENLIFHSPYNKLVQKSFARLNYLDYESDRSSNSFITDLVNGSEDKSYNKEVEKGIIRGTKDDYDSIVSPGLMLSQECGNMYTGSVYASLCSILSSKYSDESKPTQMDTKDTLIFSYGSGLVASMFSVKIQDDNEKHLDSLKNMSKNLDVEKRLKSRTKLSPDDFTERMTSRAEKYAKGLPSQLTESAKPKNMFEGSYYMKSIDNLGRRKYARAFSSLVRMSRKFVR